MNKNLVLKKNDKVTYRAGSVIDWTYIDISAGLTVKQYANNYCYKILKVERPTYTTIYEVKEILDKEEKEYLKAVIRPFRKRVANIRKIGFFDKEYIGIIMDEDNCIILPTFEKNSMYKNMEADREYTIDELGL